MGGGLSAIGQGQQMTPEQMRANYQNQLQSFLTSYGSSDAGDMLFAPGVTDPLLLGYNPYSCVGGASFGTSFGTSFGGLTGGMFNPMGMGGSVFVRDPYKYAAKDKDGKLLRDEYGRVLEDLDAYNQDQAKSLAAVRAAKLLKGSIDRHQDEDRIVALYEKFKEAVEETDEFKSAATDEQRMAVYDEFFHRITKSQSNPEGIDLEAYIESNLHSNMGAGFRNGLSLGFAQAPSASRVISRTTSPDIPEEDYSGTSRVIGRVGATAAAGGLVGAIVAGASTGTLTGAITGGGIFSIPAAGVGAIIGAGIGLATYLWSK